MANYECAVRTNYFHVKDEIAFKELMGKVVCSEDGLDIFERKDEKGMTMYGFGCYSSIMGIATEGEDKDEYSYDKFIDELQKNVELLDFENNNWFEVFLSKVDNQTTDNSYVSDCENIFDAIAEMVDKIAEMKGGIIK